MHRESIPDPIHVPRTVSPSSACLPVYLLPTNELCILSCFLALLVGDGRSEMSSLNTQSAYL